MSRREDRQPPVVRVFARLATPVKPGDVVTPEGWEGRWRVETANVAGDLRYADCVLRRQEP